MTKEEEGLQKLRRYLLEGDADLRKDANSVDRAYANYMKAQSDVHATFDLLCEYNNNGIVIVVAIVSALIATPFAPEYVLWAFVGLLITLSIRSMYKEKQVEAVDQKDLHQRAQIAAGLLMKKRNRFQKKHKVPYCVVTQIDDEIMEAFIAAQEEYEANVNHYAKYGTNLGPLIPLKRIR